MDNNYTIYIHINKINKKVYVGQTSQPIKDRWRNGHGYSTQVFGKAIEKYGWNNFEHIVLYESLSHDEANQKEIELIAFFDSTNPNKGYNQTSGGSKHTYFSEEAKRKISKSWTKERKQKLIERNKNYFKDNPDKRKLQQDFIRKLNKTIDRTGKNNSMYGKNRTGANAGNKKLVRCKETGEIFETVTDASKWCNNGKNSLKSHIAQQIRGERKSCGKHPVTKEPLHWEYIDNN